MQTIRSARSVRSAVLVTATAALLAACGGGETPTATSPGGTGTDTTAAGTVTVERSRFAPVELTVDAGTTVEFTNLDPFDHTVTAASDSPLEFDSGALGQDETFEQRFDDAGTYRYFCEIHPTMRAAVIVE